MGIFSRLFGRTNTPEPEHSVPEDDSAVDTDADTRGWDAISAVFDAAYPGQEPQHWGTLIPFSMGGPDPLTGVSAYRATSPVPTGTTSPTATPTSSVRGRPRQRSRATGSR